MSNITNTTLVNAVSTQNAGGNITNATMTAFQSTTACFALEVVLVSPSGPVSAQTKYRVWFTPSSQSTAAATFAAQSFGPQLFEVTPKNISNGTTVAITDAFPAMGTNLYCWVEMPSITAANGTLTVTLIELA